MYTLTRLCRFCHVIVHVHYTSIFLSISFLLTLIPFLSLSLSYIKIWTRPKNKRNIRWIKHWTSMLFGLYFKKPLNILKTWIKLQFEHSLCFSEQSRKWSVSTEHENISTLAVFRNDGTFKNTMPEVDTNRVKSNE